jgi:DNA repair exonuclease SbcCD ATPase subunit
MTLQADLEQVEVELRIEQQRGALQDSVKVAALQQRVADLTAQIAQAEIEEKVQAEGVPFAISGVDFTALDPEVITLIELVVKADRRKNFTEQAEIDAKREEEITAYKAQAEQRISELEKHYNELEQEYLTAAAELKEQTAETLRVIAERDEARKNRDNAAAQLDEAKKEIDRLNSQVADYQKAQVFGERGAQKVVETNQDEAASINAAIQRLQGKTKSALDIALEGNSFRGKVVVQDGNFETVTSQSTGGSGTPQTTFPEASATDTGHSGILVAESTVTPPPFPTSTVDTVSEHSVHGEVAPEAETVTREEFEALKARVANLEQGKVGVAA